MFNARCAEAIIDSFVSGSEGRTQKKIKFWHCNPHKSRSAMTRFCLIFTNMKEKLGCSGKRSLDWRCWESRSVARGQCCSISAPICLCSRMVAAPGPDLAASRLSGMVLAQLRRPGWEKGVGWRVEAVLSTALVVCDKLEVLVQL